MDNIRRGYVVKSGDSISINNTRINIDLDGSLPILAGDFIDTASSNVDGLNRITTNTTVDKKNILVGSDDTRDNERYFYLGSAQSIMSKLYVDIYFDNKYGDIIVIPNLDNLGTGNNNFYNNTELTIKGYAIGYSELYDKPIKDIILPTLHNELKPIDKPKKFTKVTTVLTSIPGLDAVSGIKNVEIMGGPDKEVNKIKTKGLPIQLLVFEDNSILYDEEKRFNTFNLIQQFHSGLSLDFVNKQKIDRIVVPLNF